MFSGNLGGATGAVQRNFSPEKFRVPENIYQEKYFVILPTKPINPQHRANSQ